jgi:hypothetical protein
VSHASSIVRPPVLTSSPPQPSSAADVAPQDTQDPSAASPLPHSKPEVHALTQKTYVANQNNICSKPPQEDIPNGSVSSMPGPYYAICASPPPFHCSITQTNSTLLIVPRIQRGGSFKYFLCISFFFSKSILLPSFAPFLQTSSRNPLWPSKFS